MDLSSLNPQQAEAVRTTEGPLLILAGAGSGKTRVITVRIAYLIAEKGVAPFNILAVTFTNKAAAEMRSRVEDLLKGQRLNSAPLISTFHSLCVRILRADIDKMGQSYTRHFTIYDTDDSQKVVKACLKDLGIDEKQLQPRVVRNAISAAKNRGEDVDLYTSRLESTDERKAAIARVYKMYEDRLKQANALDFDDLLIKTVLLLKHSEETRAKYNERFKYILVDEYQDTNPLQFALIGFLTEKQKNICVVGDDAQSIYGFRQADIRNILEFEEHFPDAKVILLEQNYRSTQTILDAAHAIIDRNVRQKKKKLWTSNPGGEKLFYFQAPDGDGEARMVASKIEDHLRRNPNERVAVLYRTNAQSRVFEEALRRSRIEYNIVGGFSFYERAEVKDIIAYLKLALNPSDNVALLRVINTPARALGKTSIDELMFRARDMEMSLWGTIAVLTDAKTNVKTSLTPRAKESLRRFKATVKGLQAKVGEMATTERPVSDVVVAAIEDTGYAAMLRTEGTDESQARLENLEELVNAAVDYDRPPTTPSSVAKDATDATPPQAGGELLGDFIDHAALTSDTDKYDRNASVTLMTIHSAKGLEFPVVFIVGLEDGIFPHSRSAADEAELEEERRLAYVAITRAERVLYVSHAMRRRVYGDEIAAEPSQFLNELPLELIEDISYGPSWLSYARSAEPGSSDRYLEASANEPTYTKPKNLYTGKTYNNADAISEFFKNRGGSFPQSRKDAKEEGKEDEERRPSPLKGFEKLRSQATPKREYESRQTESSGAFSPGSHVRHPKYGTGLVLRREGSGDNVKLTISFPGHGQKKLIEKYANLEKA